MSRYVNIIPNESNTTEILKRRYSNCLRLPKSCTCPLHDLPRLAYFEVISSERVRLYLFEESLREESSHHFYILHVVFSCCIEWKVSWGPLNFPSRAWNLNGSITWRPAFRSPAHKTTTRCLLFSTSNPSQSHVTNICDALWRRVSCFSCVSQFYYYFYPVIPLGGGRGGGEGFRMLASQ